MIFTKLFNVQCLILKIFLLEKCSENSRWLDSKWGSVVWKATTLPIAT